MATAALNVARREEWVLANPWAYAFVGLTGSLLALATTQLLGPEQHFLRGHIFLVGLSGSGISLVVRLNSAGPAFLDQRGPGFRTGMLRILGLGFVSAATALTAVLLLSAFGNPDIPWRWGSLFVAWIVVAPVCVCAGLTCWKSRKPENLIPWGHEAALLLVLAGLSCVLACWSLYFGREARFEWMTMRLFLSAAAFASLVSAPFFLVSQRVRRFGLSVLFLLHFGGIGSAALSQPPAPWVITHLWTRIFRPYLEFMYLTNAYHFYAPEPDAASYLWFRLIYEDGEGKREGVWFKLPGMDEHGQHRHTVALEYQRFISMTENIAQGSGSNSNLFDQTVNPLFSNGDDDWIQTYYMLPVMKKRWRKTDVALHFRILKKKLDENPVGEKKLPRELPDEAITLNFIDHPDIYPMHLQVPSIQQYAPPNQAVRRLLASYTRHVARRPHPKNPEWKFRGVKVYKVRHMIIPDSAIVSGSDFQDPILYHPFYMGEYGPDGQLRDPEDPLLYWLLPVLRRDYSNPKSLTLDFARRHAGDENWASIEREEGRRWYAPGRAEFEPPRR